MLDLPAELRLHVYNYLIPLYVDSGDIRGLVLSCKTVKDEVCHEMRKEIAKLYDWVTKEWPFTEKPRIAFQGRLFRSKMELVIEVPYLPAATLFGHDEQSAKLRDVNGL